MLPPDERTRSDLHLGALLAALVERAGCPPGREVAARTSPAETDGSRLMRARRVEQARTVIRVRGAPGFAEIQDLETITTRAKKGALLEPDELRTVRDVAASLIRIGEHLHQAREEAPLLEATGTSLPAPFDLCARIDDTFDGSGRIRDGATAALESLRARAASLHVRLRRRIEEMVHHPDTARALQDAYFTVRNDRYVLPVRTDRRQAVGGIIHGSSNTGQTLYIEPGELVEQNNELKIVEAGIAEEEEAILRELTAEVRGVADALVDGVSIAAELDALFAAARLAEDFDLQPADTASAADELVLIGARNMALLLQHGPDVVVANDVRWSRGGRWMIVSGPNAGGKTVTLTLLGQLAWLHACGLPLPIGGASRLPACSSLHTVLGDAQDMESDLSTFTGHLARLREVIDAAQPGALVLIDEIMDGTDPVQAAALARATLEHAAARGLVGAASTHYPSLKTLADADDRFFNARVGFDAATGRPDFRLQMGAAAGSEPIAVARSTGLDPTILERATELLGEAARDSERLRDQLERALQQAREAEARAVERADTLQAEREKAAADVRERAEREIARIQAMARKAGARIDEAVREVRSLTRALQEAPSSDGARRARARLEELEGVVEDAGREPLAARPAAGNDTARRPAPEPELGVGAFVRVGSSGREGRLEVVRGDDAEVRIGGVRLVIPMSDLAAATPPDEPEAPHERGLAARGAFTAVPHELDLRGRRVDDALSELDSVLDGALLSGRRELRIIHGHGTAALKKAVRRHLGRSRYVARHEPEPPERGGDGATRVWLDL